MMEKYYNFDTERLNAVPLSSVVEWLDETKRKGCRLTTKCPWHDDHHPSLVLYEGTNENRCYCFSCGKGGSVIDYVMAHEQLSFIEACRVLSDRYSIPYDTDGKNVKTVYRPKVLSRPAATKPVRPITFVPYSYAESTVTIENSFSQCLLKMYDQHLVQRITEEYLIGRYDDGWIENGAIFWTIDNKGNVRNGKVQRYITDINDERFGHCDKSKTIWLSKKLVEKGIVPTDPNFNMDCLYGEHLLRIYPEAIVFLVESPKNALIGAAEMPEGLWLATGNKGALKREVLKTLKGRDVIVIPDRDAIQEWTEKLKGMIDIANFTVMDFCETHAPDVMQKVTKNSPEDFKKYDIADYIIDKNINKLAF